MLLAGLADGRGQSIVVAAAADRPPLLAPGSWGVGLMWLCCRWWLAFPLHTAPLLVTQGGRGEMKCQPGL
jgi:hypothetical protein